LNKQFVFVLNQTLQTQKEKSICGMIKMLTSFGKNGVEWDEYNIMDLIKMKDGKFNSQDIIYSFC
jgi:hypothetical protein